MSPRRIFHTWLALLGLTALTWWLGEHGLAAAGHPLVRLGVLVFAAAKAGLIAWEWMELRGAPRLWKRIVGGWIAAVTTLIALLLARG